VPLMQDAVFEMVSIVYSGFIRYLSSNLSTV
jgi:hypothetical protein